MSGPFKSALTELSEQAEHEDESTDAKLELAQGRKLVVKEGATGQLVEIRNESGMLELRIRLTSDGPVLQMEAVRLELRAQEAVQIESPRVEIKGTEHVSVTGGKVEVHGEEELRVDSEGDVRVVGKMIHLN